MCFDAGMFHFCLCDTHTIKLASIIDSILSLHSHGWNNSGLSDTNEKNTLKSKSHMLFSSLQHKAVLSSKK